MSPVLRKGRPAGILLRQHRKSKCPTCSAAGGCGINPVSLALALKKKDSSHPIKKGLKHALSHATHEEQMDRLKKW